MVYIHQGTLAQATELTSDITVNTEDELVMALANEDISSVTIGNDIEISKNNLININGDKKSIKGNNHVLHITNGDISFTSNVKLDEFSNIKMNSNNQINLILKYGGIIDNLQGDKINVDSNSSLELYRSSVAYIKIENGPASKIVDSMINGQGVYLDKSPNTIIDYVTINLGDTYGYGIYLATYSNTDISNTTITGGYYGIYANLNGMSSNITNTKISGSKQYGIYNSGDVNGSTLVLSNVEISETGSYGIYNKGAYSQGTITIAPETNLTLNTGNNIGIYQENGYLNDWGKVIHNGNQFTLLNSNSSTINDPNENMKLIHQVGPITLFNSINRSGEEVVLGTVQVKTEEELRNALLDEKVNNVQLINDIEIINPLSIEVKGILKKLIGENFKLNFVDGVNPQITANQFLEIENLTINNDNSGGIILEKGGILNNIISTKIRVSSTGEAHISNSELEGISINNGNHSKIISSNIGSSGIYFYFSQNTIIDNVNINLGDTYNSGIMLSTFTSSDISNTTVNGGYYGIYANLNGMSANITNTKISGSKQYGIYNSGDVNGSTLVLSNVEISDTGSYGIYNKGAYSQGTITITPETNLTINTLNSIGIYQENGYLNVLGKIIDNGNQYTILNSNGSAINDPIENMKLIHQIGPITLFNSLNKSGEEVILETVQVKTEEELRNALLDEKVNNVQLINDIEIFKPLSIEVRGILKKLIGGNFKLIFGEDVSPQITADQFLEIENLTINNDITGGLILNKGGILNNIISTKIRVSSTGEAHVRNSDLEGISINNGNNSKIISSNIGSSGIYFYFSQNTIIDNVNINLGDTNNNGIMLSTFTSSDISNTTITGGYYGIYASLNGMSANITNTKISGSKQYGIYNSGDVNGSTLVLSNVEISDTGGYGIYNTGGYSQGSITIAPETNLTLKTGNNIGIYQENGHFDLNGNIISENSGIIISSDYKSQINDNNNQLVCLNPTTDSFKDYVLMEKTYVETIILTGAGNETTVGLNKNLQINASVVPSDATDKTVTWSVESGTGTANISPTGVLTGLSSGTVIVKATANDGSGISGSITIKVVISVNFESQGGSSVAGIIVDYGSLISVPQAPTRTGFTFGGWYKDAACTNPWDFSIDTITSDTTLYAKWKINSYSVTFNSQGGTFVPSTITNYDTLIVAPKKPTRIGYTFVGWYKEPTYSNAWNFSLNRVTSNTTLYGEWVKNPSAPISIKASSSSYDSISLSWGAVLGATGYEIYRATSSAGNYSLISRTSEPNYSNTGLVTNTTYYFKVKAYKISGNIKAYSDFSIVVSVKPTFSAPINLKAVGISPSSIKLTWNGVSEAHGYEIYRSTSSNGTYSLLAETTSLFYTNSGLESGKAYFYRVRSYRISGSTKVYSSWTPVIYIIN